VELILVMGLSRAETWSKGLRLGALAAIMVILGYPGEISSDPSTRWIWWALAMVPFAWIVYELFIGLGDAIAKQPDEVRGLVDAARWLTVIAWSFYPVVFVFPMIGLTGGMAATGVELGYTIADITAKAAFGVLIYMIAVRKSAVEQGAYTDGQRPRQPAVEAGTRDTERLADHLERPDPPVLRHKREHHVWSLAK
jgi:bacteriorhodopsin